MIPCAAAKGKITTAEWLVMLYADGDTGEYDGVQWAVIQNIEEIKSATFNKLVRIVAQIDITDNWDEIGGDWEGGDNGDARRYEVYPRSVSLADNTLGEVNMGHPDTLSDFVVWAIESFPAYKYAVIFMDHGEGWNGVCRDASHSDDMLDMDDLDTAFSDISTATGKSIDLVGFDACLMQHMSVAYQLKEHADVMVASEGPGYYWSEEGYEGMWPYDTIIQGLGNDPWMDAESLGTLIVQEYGIFFETVTWDDEWYSDTTMSAIRLSEVDTATYYIDILGTGLWAALDYPDWVVEIEDCIDATQFYSRFKNSPYLDLYDFVEEILNSSITSRTVRRSAWYLIDTIDYDLLVAEWHNTGGYWPADDSHGIGVYLPYVDYQYDPAFGDTDFCTIGAPYWWTFIVEFNALQ